MADTSGFFFDIEKWRGSRTVQRMSFAERGVFKEMLVEQWQRRNLPDDVEAIVDLLANTDKQAAEIRAAWPVVRQKFALSSDGKCIYNIPLERVRRVQKAFKRKKQLAGALGGKRAAKNRLPKEVLPQGLEASSATANASTALAKPSVQTRQDKSSSDQSRQELKDPACVSDPFLDEAVTERAGAFVRHYEALYPQYRKGARYAVKPVRDYAAAVTLCRTWLDDDRLHKLAIIFLTTDHQFAESGSRTIPQFLALASWCDSKLADAEQKAVAS